MGSRSRRVSVLVDRQALETYDVASDPRKDFERDAATVLKDLMASKQLV